MLNAKPIQVFSLGKKRVVVCLLPADNPADFLDRELSFYSQGRFQGRIRIEGLSTASREQRQQYDFSYSGDEVRQEQLGETAILTDGQVEEALREFKVA